MPRSRPTERSDSFGSGLSGACVDGAAWLPAAMEKTLLAWAVRKGRMEAGLPSDAGHCAGADPGSDTSGPSITAGPSTVAASSQPPERIVVAVRGAGSTLVVVAMATG